MKIPRCQLIEVPKIEEIFVRKTNKKPFVLSRHYLRYSLLPQDQLENVLGYEASEADLAWRDTFGPFRSFCALEILGLIEKSVEMWENDTNKGQIIPLERAVYLIKEGKVVENSEESEACRFFDKLYVHWITQRGVHGRPLLRKYWKSEGISDSQVKIAFQPRGGYRERMRTRNSRKNDLEAYEKVSFMQMKALVRHFELLQELTHSIYQRESVKKLRTDLLLSSFEQERSERLSKPLTPFVFDASVLEASKEFRKSINVLDQYIAPVVDIQIPSIHTNDRIDLEKPIKRPRPEVQVKKKDLPYEIARVCCFLIAEGEKLQRWPIVDPSRRPAPEVQEVNMNSQHPHYERSLKMRGRIARGVNKITIDRLTDNDNEHKWGRYLGLNGTWHSFNGEACVDDFDNDDNEALMRTQKLILQNFKSFVNKIKK